MYSNLKEKRLYVLKLKLKNVEQHTGFFRRNLLKIILSIIGLSLYVSFLTDVYSNRYLLTITKNQIENELMFTVAICTFFSLLAHIIWGAQDRVKIKKLKKEIEDLQKELML